jgi:hypothetical protein
MYFVSSHSCTNNPLLKYFQKESLWLQLRYRKTELLYRNSVWDM